MRVWAVAVLFLLAGCADTGTEDDLSEAPAADEGGDAATSNGAEDFGTPTSDDEDGNTTAPTSDGTTEPEDNSTADDDNSTADPGENNTTAPPEDWTGSCSFALNGNQGGGVNVALNSNMVCTVNPGATGYVEVSITSTQTGNMVVSNGELRFTDAQNEQIGAITTGDSMDGAGTFDVTGFDTTSINIAFYGQATGVGGADISFSLSA